MSGPQLLEALVTLGGFSGIAAMLASLAAFAKAKEVKQDTRELRPNHGSSISDRVDLTLEMVKSQGHQLGEHHGLMLRVIDQMDSLGDRITRLEDGTASRR